MKEFLAAREVAFESINVLEDDAALAELREAGMGAVPVVACNDRYVYGVALDQVARLLALDFEVVPVLAPAELITRYERVLRAGVGFAQQIPEERLGDSLPNRDRSYVSLANHMVQIAADFLTIAEGADLRGALAKSEPATNRTPADLLRRVGDLQQALAAWLHEVDAAQLQRTVRTYFGDQTLHQVLERAVWHSAQHARQLAMVLELLDIEPADPLSAADLADLPMPQNVWDG